MALDGAMLGLVKNSLNDLALGSRIEKITMPYKDCICLFLNKPGFKKTLLISANPNSARIHFTNEKFENPAVPPMLCMLLRKRLGNGRLRAVRQYGIDRILMLDFDCKNEFQDDIVVTIVVEMLGRLANIIIVENGKIIDSVRRVDPEENKRFILPNATYEFPPATNRLNLFETQSEIILEKILSHKDKTATKAISATIDGLSPVIYREIAYLSFNDIDLPVSEINAYRASKLLDTLKSIKNIYKNGVFPCILKDENDNIKDFTFINIKQYEKAYTILPFDDIHTLLENYFSKKDGSERIKQVSQSVTKTVNNLISRTKRKIFARETELKATEKKELYRVYGELIKANLHAIKPGENKAVCLNYYDPECKQIEIPLDSSLSPIKNSHKYFKDYRKLSTASNMLNELIDKAKEELVYFESVLDALKRAKTPSDIEAIKEELQDGGYIRSQKKAQKRKAQKQNPDRYISSDGFEILVGKNNYQNDWLTTKFAEKTDIWFHTKNIPGSHVLVLANKGEVPDTTKTEAAILAATNSRASDSKQVPVDFTMIKFVKKPAGAKPGMVIYKTNKTAFVDPDFSLAEKLKQ